MVVSDGHEASGTYALRLVDRFMGLAHLGADARRWSFRCRPQGLGKPPSPSHGLGALGRAGPRCPTSLAVFAAPGLREPPDAAGRVLTAGAFQRGHHSGPAPRRQPAPPAGGECQPRVQRALSE